MQDWLIPLLRCPQSGEPLSLEPGEVRDKFGITEGKLVTPSGITYPIVRGVPRFVENHYASGFGFQWNTHNETQIDRTKLDHSEQRFFGETGLTAEVLRGSLVIDGGCGAGRFTDIAAKTGARVVAIDLSSAVDACHQLNLERDNVCVVQASLFELPFAGETFDHGFTIGVIQHTPDPLRALRVLAGKIRKGGQLGVSWYKKYWYTYLHQKYLLRPLFKAFFKDDQRLYEFVSWYVPKLLPLSRLIQRVTRVPEFADRILPVANRDYIDGLDEEEKREWAILDTYDWFNPAYDKPQSWRAVEKTLTSMGYSFERAPLARRGLHATRQKATTSAG